MSCKKVARKTRSSDDLKAAFWKAGGFKQGRNGETTKWGFLGRLHNQDIACSKSWRCFHDQRSDWGVERVDSGANSKGLMADKLDEAVVGGKVAVGVY